ncbi:MAG TPA: chaperone modulator CbpM [Gammaproteobacteria bacterium]
MGEGDPITGDVLDERVELSLTELCRMCGLHEEAVIEMVEEGIIEPRGSDRSAWRFSGVAVTRVQRVVRLQRELEVNLPGAALALELLDEIERLRRRLP